MTQPPICGIHMLTTHTRPAGLRRGARASFLIASLAMVSAVLAAGCRAAPTPPSAGTAPDEEGAPATATATASATAAPAPAPAPAALVLDDLALICDGMFAVDHLGPEAFESVRARVLAQTPTYLDALGPFFGACDDHCLGARHPMAFLSLAAESEADGARAAGCRLIPTYEAALERSAHDADLAARLRDRLAGVASFADCSAAAIAPP